MTFCHAVSNQTLYKFSEDDALLQITISLFCVAAKHPEEGSNAKTSADLYLH